ncbi:hypothetical protein B4U80_13706 [Leptotrombidium deliense]|uniref:Uncharacterized protein n=1 Tax=Leptotrombidium deliense TaxID=299467 RepID=A0A443SJJ1_9ACAR|nr:hypothetical protein B4U80_13706 [Leptotrombidium deliense]
MACYGSSNKKNSPCVGDGGGALAVRIKNSFFQKDLLLNSKKCEINGAPSVFLKLQPFRAWIKTQTGI